MAACRTDGDVSLPCHPGHLDELYPVTAVNGDGTSLPAGTLQELEEIDERIESVTQPLPGFGGRTAETERNMPCGNRCASITGTVPSR